MELIVVLYGGEYYYCTRITKFDGYECYIFNDIEKAAKQRDHLDYFGFVDLNLFDGTFGVELANNILVTSNLNKTNGWNLLKETCKIAKLIKGMKEND